MVAKPARRHRDRRWFLGYILGHWLGNYIGSAYPYIANSGQNSLAVLLALLFMVAGWLLGLAR